MLLWVSAEPLGLAVFSTESGNGGLLKVLEILSNLLPFGIEGPTKVERVDVAATSNNLASISVWCSKVKESLSLNNPEEFDGRRGRDELPGRFGRF